MYQYMLYNLSLQNNNFLFYLIFLIKQIYQTYAIDIKYLIIIKRETIKENIKSIVKKD